VRDEVRMPVQGTCKRCGYISSQELCKACILLEGLNRGLPRLGIGKATAANLSEMVRKMALKEDRQQGGVAGSHADRSGKEKCVGGVEGHLSPVKGCVADSLVDEDLVKGCSGVGLPSPPMESLVKGGCLSCNTVSDAGGCAGGGACQGGVTKVDEEEDGGGDGCERGGASQKSEKMGLLRTSLEPAGLDF